MMTLHHGDSLDILRSLPPHSVDALVTDPPAGIGFMGKAWDRDKGGRLAWIGWMAEVMREALRVLKPGGHALVWALPRTSHWTATALEEAGFEIRDRLAHIFGSGFPKSLDVSKAIDKARREDAEPTRVICRFIRSAMDAKGLKSRHMIDHFGGCHPRLIDHWAARDTDSQPSLPTWDQWLKLKEILDVGDEMDAEVLRLVERKGRRGDAWENAEIVGEQKGVTPGFGEHRFPAQDSLIRSLSEPAQQWEGWGTALKPAAEDWWLCRKPLRGTVAANVLEWGTGAINVNGCRVGANGGHRLPPGSHDTTPSVNAYGQGLNGPSSCPVEGQGRWPAHLILSHSPDCGDTCVEGCPIRVMGEQSGESAGRSGGVAGWQVGGYVGGSYSPIPRTGHTDQGTAARYFLNLDAPAPFLYCPKPSTRERDQGVGGEVVQHHEITGRVEGSAGSNNPRAGVRSPRKNIHPTVKPIKLMRYLCRLITPPGGTVLDPFMGSGTTGIAATMEGFHFIGIEREEEYLEIARQRIAHAAGAEPAPIQAAPRQSSKPAPQLSLFEEPTP